MVAFNAFSCLSPRDVIPGNVAQCWPLEIAFSNRQITVVHRSQQCVQAHLQAPNSSAKQLIFSSQFNCDSGFLKPRAHIGASLHQACSSVVEVSFQGWHQKCPVWFIANSPAALPALKSGPIASSRLQRCLGRGSNRPALFSAGRLEQQRQQRHLRSAHQWQTDRTFLRLTAVFNLDNGVACPVGGIVDLSEVLADKVATPPR